MSIAVTWAASRKLREQAQKAMRTCSKCGEEFLLLPGKPGLANECPKHSRERVQRITVDRVGEAIAVPGDGIEYGF